jgi:DNA-binding PadR family transcriptional regulator
MLGDAAPLGTADGVDSAVANEPTARTSVELQLPTATQNTTATITQAAVNRRDPSPPRCTSSSCLALGADGSTIVWTSKYMLGNYIPSAPGGAVSVRLSLLALLDQGACYGYQLRTELDWRTGSTGPINVGQIYNTLDRLERDKLVRKTGENNYYEITPAGSAEVASWFGSASPAADLAAKLALASTLPGVDVASVIRAQRASATPPVLDPTPTTSSELAHVILATAAAFDADSELRLLNEVERLLGLGVEPTPLSSEVPKRGRPAKITS